MKPSVERLLVKAEEAELSWHPVRGGLRGWVCFDDKKVFDLGADPSGDRFKRIAERMMSGHFYPPDAIRVHGRFALEGRDLCIGDRLLQQAPLLGKLGGPVLHSAVEIYVAEKTEGRCRIGYVSTAFHFGRGIWNATLERQGSQLSLAIESIASPHSWLFWVGLPIARWLQLRARRRAVETFRAL